MSGTRSRAVSLRNELPTVKAAKPGKIPLRKLFCALGRMENLGELTAPARTQGCRVKTLNLAIAPGRNRQAADTTISPVIIKTVSCSVLAPARVIAIASSTPGKTCAGAQASADRILAA